MTMSKRLESLEQRKRKKAFSPLPIFFVSEDETIDDVLKRYCDENGLEIDVVRNRTEQQLIYFQAVSV